MTENIFCPNVSTYKLFNTIQRNLKFSKYLTRMLGNKSSQRAPNLDKAETAAALTVAFSRMTRL
jgi:hypothetical protein